MQENNSARIEWLIRHNNINGFYQLVKEIGVDSIKCNSDLSELAAIHWAASRVPIPVWLKPS